MIAAIVPFEVAGAAQVTVQVSYGEQQSAAQIYMEAASALGIFTDNASGIGEGAILNGDGSLNSADDPALPGSAISVYATGGGVANTVDPSGAIAVGLNPLAASTTATVGGQPAQIVYAGDAPGEVAGMVQFNIQVPGGVAGTVPIVVTAGGQSSQTTATVAIAGAAAAAPAKGSSKAFAPRLQSAMNARPARRSIRRTRRNSRWHIRTQSRAGSSEYSRDRTPGRTH